MIIVNINGGIGNQLFQYAAARSLSLEMNRKLILNTYQLTVSNAKRKLQIDALQITFNKLIYPFSQFVQNEKILTFGQKYLNNFFVKELNYDQACGSMLVLDDYFQGEKYFQKHKETILREFRLKQVCNNLQAMFKKLQQINAVSIHIRRGDYVHHTGFGLLNLEYYQTAVKQIMNSVSDPVFILFSDDMNWVRENDFFRNLNFLQIDFNQFSDIESLMLMSHCKHHIIANSSYSWWGAYLSENQSKMVLRPRNHWKNTPHNDGIYYPNKWVAIENSFVSC